MEKRIELERRARKAHQITELNLDNCRSTSIVGLTDEYTSLESLSLINVGLTTLKGFPKLPNLKKLELSDNRISNGLNYLHTSPKLQYLNLSGNKIKDLEALKPLKEFKHLTILDLFNNEATHIQDYRDKTFIMLPSLRFLDGFDCNDVEAPSEADDEDGTFSEEEEDKQNAFCLNGLEIDLDELEEFEKRVRAKREAKLKEQRAINVTTISTSKNEVACHNNAIDTTVAVSGDDVDELDEYLKALKLRELQNDVEKKSANETSTTDYSNTGTSANFAILLYWFLAILNFASATFNTPLDDDDDDDDDSDIYSSDDNVSLSEVYNDDLEEEDEDEWEEGNAGENYDYLDVDDDSEDEEANQSTVAKDDKDGVAGAEEPQSRGKKRKHEG